MPRITPLTVAELTPEARVALNYAEDTMRFVPNDALILARWPELLTALQPLVHVIYKPGELPRSLKGMMATVVSGAAGCRYCQAHTALGAMQGADASAEKVAAVWQFRESPLFTAAERAALEFALAAGQQPNGVTDEHFARLREHYGERAILEMVGLIALFGFLNRWNDTVATPLEAAPLEFARKNLRPEDWTPGKHVGGDAS